MLGLRAVRVRGQRANNPNAYPKKRLHLNLAARYQGQDDLDREYDFCFLTEEQAASDSIPAENGEEPRPALWFPIRDVLKFRDGVDVDTEKLMLYNSDHKLTGWGGGTLAKLCNVLVKNQVIHYLRRRSQ